MELAFALLADGVVQRPDGKLDIFGAGIDQVNTLGVPVLHPTLTLAARLLLTRQEARSRHRLELDVIDPDGEARMPTLTQRLDPLDPEQLAALPRGTPIGIGLVVQIQAITFERAGPHAVMMLWDGNELARLPLHVRIVEPPQLPEAAS